MRISAFLMILMFAAATAAPASACVIAGIPVSYYFDEPPADLDPAEVVLEVRPHSAAKLGPPQPGSAGDEQAYLHRFSVVRVVRGKFVGEAVVFPLGSLCQSYLAPPPNGAETGLLVGFVMPPSPEWRDAPGMELRSPRSPVQREPVDPAVIAAAEKGDPSAMMTLVRSTRNPAVKKHWHERATQILRTRADAGDASAMLELGLALRWRTSFDFKTRVDAYTEYKDPAEEWVRRAADLGNSPAMYLMAEAYSVRISADATNWYLKAAEAGHVCAMGKLAQRYRFGWGTPQNKEQALYWYWKAIVAGAVMSPYGYEIDGDSPPSVAMDKPSLQCPTP